jgi:hypothetical protein
VGRAVAGSAPYTNRDGPRVVLRGPPSVGGSPPPLDKSTTNGHRSSLRLLRRPKVEGMSKDSIWCAASTGRADGRGSRERKCSRGRNPPLPLFKQMDIRPGLCAASLSTYLTMRPEVETAAGRVAGSALRCWLRPSQRATSRRRGLDPARSARPRSERSERPRRRPPGPPHMRHMRLLTPRTRPRRIRATPQTPGPPPPNF